MFDQTNYQNAPNSVPSGSGKVVTINVDSDSPSSQRGAEAEKKTNGGVQITQSEKNLYTFSANTGQHLKQDLLNLGKP